MKSKITCWSRLHFNIQVNSIEMNSFLDTSFLRFNRNYLRKSASPNVGDMTESTNTTLSPAIKCQHDNSAASFEHNLPQRTLNPREDFQKFSTKLMKNKTSLVQRRLALKRQRTSLKPTIRKLAPIYTDKLQMELGNLEGFPSPCDQDEEDLRTMISQNIHSSIERSHPQSISNQSSPLRDDTPHTLPTDISLLYRYISECIRIFLFKLKLRYSEQ